jgi:hypothetical protein
MAANIFNSPDYANIQKRIEQLNAENQRRWGKMTLPEMLTHCGIQLKKALGILPQTPFEGPALYRTAPGRWLALYAFPWPKGSPTPSQMNMAINHVEAMEMEIARKELLQLLQDVQSKEALLPHPFFGQMNKKDWGRLIWKHVDHHLRQFNA